MNFKGNLNKTSRMMNFKENLNKTSRMMNFKENLNKMSWLIIVRYFNVGYIYIGDHFYLMLT